MVNDMNDAPAEADPRLQRGYEVEGWAFTFCKAAFLALIFERYTLLATAAIGMVLYIIAAGYGVREWRCWVKHPWVTVALAAIAGWQVWSLFLRR
jgi:hypothetical protein